MLSMRRLKVVRRFLIRRSSFKMESSKDELVKVMKIRHKYRRNLHYHNTKFFNKFWNALA